MSDTDYRTGKSDAASHGDTVDICMTAVSDSPRIHGTAGEHGTHLISKIHIFAIEQDVTAGDGFPAGA